MEEALIKLKHRNDDLTRQSKGLLDGQTLLEIGTPSPSQSISPATPVSNEPAFEQAKDEPNRDHGERIVEMVSVVVRCFCRLFSLLFLHTSC